MNRKIMRVLTRLLLLVFAVCLPSGGVSAQSDVPVGTAVVRQDARMDILLKNASIREVFSEIRKLVKVNFMYSNEDVKDLPTKDYDLRNATLEQVMNVALAGSDLTFGMVKDTIIIKRKGEAKRNITGKVMDVSGQPIPGVAVQVKGTARGTTTDMDGHFELPSDNRSEVKLSLSFVGMKRQELTWRGRALSIVMEEDARQIDEVVVTGYQVINRRALTSAVTTVKAEDIIRPDALSIDQMLEGQVPDMLFMSNSGEAGVAPKIRIRGTSSIIGNREPLWVVDGIVVTDPVQISPEELNDPDYVNRIGNAIAGLNPQDIERLDILKDASATALYGTKAANGVIVITTKRGRNGKPQIRYNNSFTYKLRPRYTDRSVDVMNSKERIQFSRELFASGYEYDQNSSPVGYEGLLLDLYNGKINDDQFATEVAKLEVMNTDWFDLLTHDSFSQQHTVSMNGGSERGTYYASIGYNDTDDVVNNTMNKRYTGMLNLDAEFTKWLSGSFSFKGNVNKRSYNQTSLNPVQYAYTASRAIPAYTEDGEYYFYDKITGDHDHYLFNIMNELDHSSISQEGSSFSLDANFRFKFNDWLSANAIGSYTSQSTDINNYWGMETYQVASWRGSNYGEEFYDEDTTCPQGGQLSTQHTRQNSWTVRLQLDWNKYFGKGEKHNFNGGLGYEASSTRYKGYSNTARGYFPDRGLSFVQGIDLEKYPSYQAWVASNAVPTLTDDLSNVISAYATMTYSYNSMVYLNANARVDGSNRFGDQSNSKLLPIWSVSAAFNFSELPFMKRISWMDYLKAKVSYGFQGNMLSDESPVMIIRKNPMNDYYNEFTASAMKNPNPDLKWERTNSYNIGLEASLFNNRLQLEASVYFKRTKDAFMPKSISTVNGYESYVVNGGNISNDGYSVDVTVHPIMTKDWRWTLSASFSRTLNEIKTLPAGEEYELGNFLNGTAVVKGQPVGTFYSYKFLGLSPVDGGPMFDDYFDHYEDLQGLDKYDTYTRVLAVSGTREPYMSGSLNTTLRYKSFRLSGSFAYSLGAKTRLFGMFGGDSSNAQVYDANDIRPEWNMSRDYLDRWMKPGDELRTTIPAIIGLSSDSYFNYINHWSANMTDEGINLIADSYWDMYDYSDIRVVSANYLKCTNVSLAYEVPVDWLKPFGLSRLELTLSGNNLFTICDSKLKGQTPTQGGFTTIELSDRPSCSFGLSLTF